MENSDSIEKDKSTSDSLIIDLTKLHLMFLFSKINILNNKIII